MSRAVARYAALACVLSMWSIAGGPSSAATPSASLGGVQLGAPVARVVKAFGAPGLVESTDDGHEWRWFDASGLDVDLLTDSTLTVRQILLARPEPVRGEPSKLVQPQEFPVLERPASAATAYMRSIGATHQAEPEPTVSAWHVGSDLIVLELLDGKVRKILALDALAAANLGYALGPKAPAYRAPRLVKQYATDYPPGHAKGVVVVEVELSASGSVKDVHVLVSSGDAGIDAAETLSMRRSKFQPARCDGQPCESIYLDREEYTG